MPSKLYGVMTVERPALAFAGAGGSLCAEGLRLDAGVAVDCGASAETWVAAVRQRVARWRASAIGRLQTRAPAKTQARASMDAWRECLGAYAAGAEAPRPGMRWREEDADQLLHERASQWRACHGAARSHALDAIRRIELVHDGKAALSIAPGGACAEPEFDVKLGDCTCGKFLEQLVEAYPAMRCERAQAFMLVLRQSDGERAHRVRLQ
jgi:hypothetical protein